MVAKIIIPNRSKWFASSMFSPHSNIKRHSEEVSRYPIFFLLHSHEKTSTAHVFWEFMEKTIQAWILQCNALTTV